MIKPTRAFKKARGLWNNSGPGFIGLSAYVVRAQHRARAHGLGPRPVPALLFLISFTIEAKVILYSISFDERIAGGI